jgi:hypothetical protein
LFQVNVEWKSSWIWLQYYATKISTDGRESWEDLQITRAGVKICGEFGVNLLDDAMFLVIMFIDQVWIEEILSCL